MSQSSSKTSLSLSPRLSRRVMSATTPTLTPLTPLHTSTFGSRRGNVRFSSGRFNPPKTSCRSRKSTGSLLSFRSSRRTAARPARTKGVFESLIGALTDGIEAVRLSVDEMKGKLPNESVGTMGSRVNYYMELEKQIKSLERKIRTLEVHKDRIEEMQDEYILKLKLRDGAFNIAQALATQSSKAAKEKLQEARMEQRELLEDLCDIEDELETKLGVFKVHINGLVGLGRQGNGDMFETQLKLSSQKWKARCKISRQQQLWQDEDIVFLGKVVDELFVKVVEVKKIQGNVNIGNMKCLTRELFSFFPLNVTFNFPSSSVKLNMDVRWTPTLGDDFLSELGLHTIHCLVGGQSSKLASRPSSCGNVERLHLYPSDQLITGLNVDTVIHQIRIITEPEDTDPHRNSYERTEVKTKNVTHKRKGKKRKDDDTDFVYLDRQSIIVSNMDGRKQSPEVKQLLESQETGSTGSGQVKRSPQGSLGSSQSSGSGYYRRQGYCRFPEDTVSLNTMMEAVTFALEEPRDQYPELRGLECQLSRLEVALKGGKLIKSPSMTLSESQAMDSFDFLSCEEATISPRFSRASYPEDHENFPPSFFVGDVRPPRISTPSNKFSSMDSDFHQESIDSQQDEVFSSGYHEGGGDEGSNSTGTASTQSQERGTTGVESVDIALVQHLIHCESLLQHLQSAGPLRCKLITGLRKLQQEAEIIAELLNIAAEQSAPTKIRHILPELAANDQLMRFWRSVAKNDLLSVSYEQFAVGLDERFGHSLWKDFPEVANRVFTELLGRILDLDADDWGPTDNQMVITVFQYAAYFLTQGSNGILKCMREVAQELRITEGLLSGDNETRQRIASHLSENGYNCGALMAAAYILANPNSRWHESAEMYLQKFAGNSPWHSKAVQFYIEQLEHTDQVVRTGACSALCSLGTSAAVPQLRYLAKGDFSPVRAAACKALVALGEPDPSVERSGFVYKPSIKSMLTPQLQTNKHSPLQRTRSAETALNSDPLATTV